VNVFAVDRDPVRAARALCDRHVVKMTLETAQILCTAARAIFGQRAPYRPTHASHPCVAWAAARRANWDWLVSHGLALAAEYERRYGRVHTSRAVIARMARRGPPRSSDRRQPFVQAMPEQYRGRDAVAAYRRYYAGEKARFATWKAPARPPRWWRGSPAGRAGRAEAPSFPAARGARASAARWTATSAATVAEAIPRARAGAVTDAARSRRGA
jgi:hypothetical protein